MAWGVTSAGFVRKKLSEIKTDLETAVKQYFGAAANVGTSSVFGRIIGIFATPTASLWELAESVYNSFSPDTASGVALDNAVALTGIKRKNATYGSAWAVHRMLPAITIPAGSRVQVLDLNPAVVFAHDLDVVTPLAAACWAAWIQVGAVAVGDTYRVTISGTNHDFVAPPAATPAIILNGLATAIEAGALAALVRAVLMSGEDTLQVLLEPEGSDVQAARSFAVSVAGGGGGTLSITHTGGVGYLTCSATGPYEAPAGTLSVILDPVAGWVSVRQLVDADAGADIESDADLRLRREQSIHVSNGGTVDAIRTALLEIEEVETAIVHENITDAVDGTGLPPHSVYAIVESPIDPDVDDAIRQTLWDSKPGGIATYGAVSGSVEDSMGFDHVICFGRVVDVRIYLRVEYTPYTEETFPAAGAQGIMDACEAYGVSDLTIGKDLIPQRFVGPIYAAVEGIQQLTVGASLNPLGPFLATKISIAADRRATVDSADVTVVLVP